MDTEALRALPTHIRTLLADTVAYLSATLREEITEVSDAEYIIARARAALAQINGKEG